MAKLNVNFDEVPNEVQPVDPGTYTAAVEEANLEETKDGKGMKVVVKMKIKAENNPNDGRLVFDHISTKMQTQLKRLALSAGLNPGGDGYDTDDLIGKIVKIRVKNAPYKDEKTGETKETSRIAEYMF